MKELSNLSLNQLERLKKIHPDVRIVDQFLARRSLTRFGEHMGYESNWHHVEWDNILTSGRKKICILGPRDHGKSTRANYLFPLWAIGNWRNLRILCISKTGPLAKTHFRPVKQTIEFSDKYKTIFGNLKPRDPICWDATEIIVDRSKIMKDPSIAARGLFGSIIGLRCDILICDDIIDRENVYTKLQREKVKDWFNYILVNCLVPDGIIIIIGTRWHHADFYKFILDNPTYFHAVYQAIIDYNTQEVLWKSRWPFPKLIDKKFDIGTIIFNCQFQNDPSGLEGIELKGEWLHYYDRLPDGLRKYQGVDLAVAQTKEAAFFVICTVGYDPKTNKLYIIDFYRAKIPFPDQLDAIEIQAKIHKPLKIYVESNAYQLALAQHMQRFSALPIIPTPTVKDQIIRLVSMAAHFESERTKIGRGNNMQDFIDEWLQFPSGEYTDCLDACEIVVRNLLPLRVHRLGFGRFIGTEKRVA